jgi:serine/threonine-protein kinase
LTAVLRRLERVDRALSEPLQAPAAPQFVSLGLALRIVRPIASGGQGSVYLAFDSTLKREVAVKTAHWGDPASELRLRKEGEIAARLDHPGIAPVFGVGTTELGLPFLAMRYVPGETLQRRIESMAGGEPEQVESSLRESFAALIQVCRTLAHAHRRGILHCDVKPSNILLGENGDTALLDWGAATPYLPGAAPAASIDALEISHASSLRSRAYVLGTAEFMSPERAAGKGAWGPFSLGVVLSRLLRGSAASPSAASAAPRPDQPGKRRPDVRRLPLRPRVRKCLERLIATACEETPAARLQSAAEFAGALEETLSCGSLTQRSGPTLADRLFRRRRV